MKIMKRLLVLFLTVCFIVGGTSCSGSKLNSPDGVKTDETRCEITWNAVENATHYKVSINNKESTLFVRTRYSLANLEEGEYSIKVMAVDSKNNFANSSWSKPITYTVSSGNGLVYKSTNANTEYTVSGIGTAKGEIYIGGYYKGKPVTGVSEKALYGRSTVTGIKIGKEIKTIGAYAFASCSNLSSVVFEENCVLESLGDYAFKSCSDLKTIALPSGMTEIPMQAFAYCRKLGEITFGDNLQTIGEEAFLQCNALKNVVIPDSVTEIGKGAFSMCEGIESVVLGDGLQTLGESAFANNSALTSLTIGSSLKEISTQAFEQCSSLVSVEIPDNVEKIAIKAFSQCTALQDVKLGSGINRICAKAFEKTKLLENPIDGVYYVGNWAVGGKSVKDEELSTETNTVYKHEIVFKEGVIGIADSAFSNRNELHSAIIPDSVIYIGESAFAYCSNLTSMILGKNVKELGRRAFYDCEYLGRNELYFGESLEKIGSYAFTGCNSMGRPNMATVTFPKTLKEIGTQAFNETGFWLIEKNWSTVYVDNWLVGYKSMDAVVGDEDAPETTAITVKDGTIGICYYAFYKTRVTNVSLPESLKYIGTAAFSNCSKLTIVSIDEFSPITEIPDYAFYGSSNLFEVKIPKKVTKIGRSAFYKSGIMTIDIPASVQEIDNYAFFNSGLEYVNFADNSKLVSIGEYAFAASASTQMENANLEEIKIPDSVKTIGKRAFANNIVLTNVAIGESVESVGEYAFSGCIALSSVTIPDSLKEISKGMFSKCTELCEVDLGKVEKIGANAFYRCSSLKQIDLPETVVSIGDYAFMNCAMSQILIGKNVTEMGAHVFNGNSVTIDSEESADGSAKAASTKLSIVIYVEAETIPEGWKARWNSANRMVILGCEFATDENGKYVSSFTKTEDSVINVNALKNAAPERLGYTFEGWSTVGENPAVFSENGLSEAPDDTVYSAVWKKAEA